MKTLKYINNKGEIKTFDDYKITKEGKIFKNNKEVKINRYQKDYDCFFANGEILYLQRAIASTYDEKNYIQNSFCKNGKWISNDKKYSKERNKKISHSMTGKKQSEEHIKKRTSKNKKPVIQFSLKGEKIKEFDSAKSAGEFLDINPASITMVCQRKRKQSGGFIWRYKNF